MSNEAEFDPGAVADAELFEDDDTLFDDERPAFDEEDLDVLEAVDAGAPPERAEVWDEEARRPD